MTLALGQLAPAPLDAEFELAPPSNRPLKRPLAYTDVFINNAASRPSANISSTPSTLSLPDRRSPLSPASKPSP